MISAKHFSEVTNGFEKRTDGLWLHKGSLDAGYLRATSNFAPRNGVGVEVGHNPGIGFIQTYNRDTATWEDTVIQGKNINLNTFGGTLNLPAGSVDTSEIASGAVQNRVGEYFAAGTWSSSQVNVWQETLVQVNGTFTAGTPVRIEWRSSLSTNANALVYSGIGFDGNISWSLGMDYIYSGTWATVCGTVYWTAVAGAHRVALFLQVNTGVVSIQGSAYSVLSVTEQKR